MKVQEVKGIKRNKCYLKNCYGGLNEYCAVAFSTGPTGGNSSSHYFQIKEIMGGQTKVTVSEEGVEVSFYGDSELKAMTKALKFIVHVFESCMAEEDFFEEEKTDEQI